MELLKYFTTGTMDPKRKREIGYEILFGIHQHLLFQPQQTDLYNWLTG